MFRNLALPAVIFSIMILTGCQTLQFKDRPKKDDSRIIQSVPQPALPQPPAPEDKPKQPETHTITIREQTIQTPAHLEGRLVLGLNETASLPNLDLTMISKLDTGAENSSVDARNIQLFERDGKKWVKFDLSRTSKGTVPMELPTKGTIRIKRPGLSAIERPVVQLTISIGEITQSVPVSLTDRSQYESPLLIGRSFMQDLAVIDVNQKFIATKLVLKSSNRKVLVPVTQKSYTRAIIKPVSVKGLETIGAIENVLIKNASMILKARIDTGAQTSSIDAKEMELFRKDDKRWVRFKILDTSGDMITLEEPIVRMVRIKRHGDDNDRRPVIKLKTRIDGIKAEAEFTLRDRENYNFPVLIGASYLEKRALVDVSQEYITELSNTELSSTASTKE